MTAHAATHTTHQEPSAGYELEDGQLVGRDYDLTDVFSAAAIVSTVQDLEKWEAGFISGWLVNLRASNKSGPLSALTPALPIHTGSVGTSILSAAIRCDGTGGRPQASAHQLRFTPKTA